MRLNTYLLMATMILGGCGNPPDYRKLSAEKLLPLAENGDAEAQFNLGSKYRIGFGVSKSYQEAFKWYKRSAEQGFSEAQFLLGGLYYRGEFGIPQDYTLAYMWLTLANNQGLTIAIRTRDELVKQMDRFQIQEAQKLSREFKPKKEKP